MVVASVTLSLITMHLVLDVFEQRLGTPIVFHPGEQPFAYDTDVMPFLPCCGSIGFIVLANSIYAVALAPQGFQPFGKGWWAITATVLALPFFIPLLLTVSAIFVDSQPPTVLYPAP